MKTLVILTNKRRGIRKEFKTENEALIWLQRNTSYSWNHAFEVEGWNLEEGKNEQN